MLGKGIPVLVYSFLTDDEKIEGWILGWCAKAEDDLILFHSLKLIRRILQSLRKCLMLAHGLGIYQFDINMFFNARFLGKRTAPNRKAILPPPFLTLMRKALRLCIDGMFVCIIPDQKDVHNCRLHLKGHRPSVSLYLFNIPSIRCMRIQMTFLPVTP